MCVLKVNDFVKVTPFLHEYWLCLCHNSVVNAMKSDYWRTRGCPVCGQTEIKGEACYKHCEFFGNLLRFSKKRLARR